MRSTMVLMPSGGGAGLSLRSRGNDAAGTPWSLLAAGATGTRRMWDPCEDRLLRCSTGVLGRIVLSLRAPQPHRLLHRSRQSRRRRFAGPPATRPVRPGAGGALDSPERARARHPASLLADEVDLIHRAPRLLSRVLRTAAPAVRDSDMVGTTLPGLTGAAFLTLARASGRPTFALVRGFPRRTIATGRRRGLTRSAMLAAMRLMELYGALLVATGTLCIPMASGWSANLWFAASQQSCHPCWIPFFGSKRLPAVIGPMAGASSTSDGSRGRRTSVLASAIKTLEADPSWTMTVARLSTSGRARGPDTDTRARIAGVVSGPSKPRSGPSRSLSESRPIRDAQPYRGRSAGARRGDGDGIVPRSVRSRRHPRMLCQGTCGYLIRNPTPASIADVIRSALADSRGIRMRAHNAWERSRSFSFPVAAEGLMGYWLRSNGLRMSSPDTAHSEAADPGTLRRVAVFTAVPLVRTPEGYRTAATFQHILPTCSIKASASTSSPPSWTTAIRHKRWTSGCASFLLPASMARSSST